MITVSGLFIQASSESFNRETGPLCFGQYKEVPHTDTHTQKKKNRTHANTHMHARTHIHTHSWLHHFQSLFPSLRHPRNVQGTIHVLPWYLFYPIPHTHKLRFSLTENQQFCPFCVDTIEDKCHVLFWCWLYSQLRSKFRLPLYRGLPRNECYSRLCSDSDDNKLLNVSRFIFFALTLRESLIKRYSLLCVRMDPWNYPYMLTLTHAANNGFFVY